jgi:hypothetical protein
MCIQNFLSVKLPAVEGKPSCRYFICHACMCAHSTLAFKSKHLWTLIKLYINNNNTPLVVYFLRLCGPAWAMASSLTRFCDHTQRRAIVDRTPLDEWSALHRDLYTLQHTQQTNIHALGGIRTHDRSRRAAVDLRRRPRGHWAFGRYSAFWLSNFLP